MSEPANAALASAVQLIVDDIRARRSRNTLLYDPWGDRDVWENIERSSVAAAEHPRLKAIIGSYLLTGDRSAARFDNVNAMSHLVARALETSTDVAIKNLLDFVEADAVESNAVFCLHGVEVDTPLALSDRVSIVPPSVIPASMQRHRFFSPTDGTLGFASIFGPPLASAAIVLRILVSPAIVPAPYEEAYTRTNDMITAAEVDVDKAFAATVLTGSKIELGARYCEHLHPGYPSVGSSVTWRSIPSRFTSSVPLDRNRCEHYFRLLQEFSEWADIERLIRRVAKARLQADPVDTHLDYGIVAESLLTRGDNTKNEVLQRLRTRAAWFLGSDAPSRRAVANRVGRLYELRSAAAHSGKLPSKGSDAWTAADRVDADKLCTELIAATLQRKRFVSQTEWNDIIYG